MVASGAFRELSAVLARLESSGAEVQHATVDENLADADGSMTAALSVDMPILDDEGMDETVSITAIDATAEEERIAVDLTVTVAGGGDAGEDTASLADAGSETDGGDARSVPAYKDRDALREAYERYETFPEMTEALDVDVTAETVRRHMVKYDIHDPDDPAPSPAGDRAATVERAADATEREATGPIPESEASTTAEDGDVSDDGGVSEEETAESQAESASPQDVSVENAITDGGSAAVTGTESRERTAAPSTVTDLLAEAEPESGNWDFDLPESLTVDDLTDAINDSQTIHELAREIGTRQTRAKEFLQAFDLIHFVCHPLATDQVMVSPDEIRRRIGAAS